MLAAKKTRSAYVLAFAISTLSGFVVAQTRDIQNLDRGAARNCGSSYQMALEQAEHVFKRLALEPTSDAYVQAAQNLAQLNWQGRQFVTAKELYEKAYQASVTSAQRREYAFMLGNINATQTLSKQAEKWWALAQDATGTDAAWQLNIDLNRVRLKMRSQASPAQALSVVQLQQFQARIRDLSIPHVQPETQLSTGLHLYDLMLASNEASMTSPTQVFSADLINEWGSYLKQLSLTVTKPIYRVQVLRFNARAAEQQAELKRALNYLSEASLLSASELQLQFQALQIERQRAQLYEKLGQDEQAKRAYQRALFYIDQLRSDLPLFDEYGNSYHQSLLQPLYLAYANLLLKSTETLLPNELQARLRQVRELMEHSRRSEMQDYLGERCSIEQLRQSHTGSDYVVPVHSAIVYPIIFADRLEILLETQNGIQRYTIQETAINLQSKVQDWVLALRQGQQVETTAGAGKLWQVLIEPVRASLQQQQIDHLTIIPDGVLRLLPFAALSDGGHFLIEKFRINISPTLSLLRSSEIQMTATPQNQKLLAGMSEPGSVVNKLPENLVQQVLAANDNRDQTRGAHLQLALRGYGRASATSETSGAISGLTARRAGELKQALALQGVEQEIGELKNLFGANQTTLLNQQFTATAFAQQLKRSHYSTIHIASHGVFGGDADHTFIMAYDDLINLRQLQSILQSRQGRTRLDLLTLSACETAEGDERAPLGLSGAALQANAKSALGSLWSVSDQATNVLMQEFYRARIQGLDKAAALRQAQLHLLRQPEYHAAFFWAAFILVGNHL